MLSIKVFELAVICVGEFIVGKKAWEYKVAPHNLMSFYLYISQ